MNASASVDGDCSDYIRLLDIIHADSSSLSDRSTAHKELESKLETQGLKAIDAGFQLAVSSYDAKYRHFGFQVIENAIKFKWNDLAVAERCYIKDACMSSVSKLALLPPSGEAGTDVAYNLVAEALARCIVEIVKREWPQNYPTFFDECESIIQSTGPDGTNVILMVWSRMIEDVILFGTVEPKRRQKDLHAAIANVAKPLSAAVATTLSDCFKSTDNPRFASLGKSALTFAVALTEAIQCNAFDSEKLFNVLCLAQCCGTVATKCLASEALLNLVNSKGGFRQRIPVMSLFQSKPMAQLCAVVERAAEVGFLGEEEYKHMKLMCALFWHLAVQLCALVEMPEWKESENFPATTFPMFLKSLLTFLKLSSLTMRSQAVSAFVTLYKSSILREKAALKDEYLGYLTDSLPVIFVRVNRSFASAGGNIVAARYAQRDYDSDYEFNVEFAIARSVGFKLVEQLMDIDSKHVFGSTMGWLVACLRSTASQPDILGQLEALGKLMDVIVPSFAKSDHWQGAVCEESVRIFDSHFLPALKLSETNFELMDRLLSFLASWTCLLRSQPARVSEMLTVVFACIRNRELKEKADRKQARWHACNALIRVALNDAELLMPHAEAIYELAQVTEHTLSPGPRNSLTEVLLIMANHVTSDSEFTAFVRHKLANTIQYLLSSNLVGLLMDPLLFMDYIGLSKPCPANSDSSGGDVTADEYTINRQTVIYHTGNITTFLRRFDAKRSEARKSDIFAFLRPAIDSWFGLIRVTNWLYSTEAISRIHSDYGIRVLDGRQTDKLVVTGDLIERAAKAPTDEGTPQDYMQLFIWRCTEVLLLGIGYMAEVFGSHFYELPQFEQYMNQGLFFGISDAIDMRLRCILHFAVRPVISHFPDASAAAVANMVIPFAQLISYVYSRLTQNWETVTKVIEGSAECSRDSDKNRDSTLQELFYEQMTITLTRDYLEILSRALVRKDPGKKGGSKRNDSEAKKMENGEEMESVEVKQEVDDTMEDVSTSTDVSTVTELGRMLIEKTDVCPALVLSVFHPLIWHDTTSVLRSVPIAVPLLQALDKLGKLDGETVGHVYTCILSSLTMHGQHTEIENALIALAQQVYDLLGCKFPEITVVLRQVPKVSEFILKDYSVRSTGASPSASDDSKPKKGRPMKDKLRREFFKRILGPIIGQNVGQAFKRKAAMRELPAILMPRKLKIVTADPNELDGIAALFAPQSS